LSSALVAAAVNPRVYECCRWLNSHWSLSRQRCSLCQCTWHAVKKCLLLFLCSAYRTSSIDQRYVCILFLVIYCVQRWQCVVDCHKIIVFIGFIAFLLVLFVEWFAKILLWELLLETVWGPSVNRGKLIV